MNHLMKQTAHDTLYMITPTTEVLIVSFSLRPTLIWTDRVDSKSVSNHSFEPDWFRD